MRIYEARLSYSLVSEGEHWERTQTTPSTPLPALPGTEKWHVAIGAEIKKDGRTGSASAIARSNHPAT